MKNGKTNLAGIDYSTTSPSICIKVDDNWDIHFLTNKAGLTQEEYWSKPFLFFGSYLPKNDYFSDPIGKYKFISSWALDVLDNYDVENVCLEDYAYAATGRVFNIGENTGILKFRMQVRDIEFITVAPTEVKKYATGKGNANKELMLSSFITQTGVDLRDVIGYTGENPISDIVDSFYICNFFRAQMESASIDNQYRS